jgi:hypothetical protein
MKRIQNLRLACLLSACTQVLGVDVAYFSTPYTAEAAARACQLWGGASATLLQPDSADFDLKVWTTLVSLPGNKLTQRCTSTSKTEPDVLIGLRQLADPSDSSGSTPVSELACCLGMSMLVFLGRSCSIPNSPQ